MKDFITLFAAIKALGKPVTVIVNETYVDKCNSLTVKRVRCPGDVEGARAINEELVNWSPIRLTMDDLNVAVSSAGWGYAKPRERGAGCEYMYHLQPVAPDNLGIAAGVALFGIDKGFQAARKEVRRQRRYDRYMVRKVVLS